MSSANNKTISTVKQLNNLSSKDKPYDIKFRNISGLTVRVSPRGTKSFRWDRGSKHKPRIITYGQFGQHPTSTLKDARSLHEKMQQQHRAGTIEIINTSTPKTITDLAELYYSNKEKTITRPDAIRQVLDKDIIPIIGGLKINAVTTLIIRGVIDNVINRGAKSHAGKVLSIIKSMFNFALANGLLTINPASPLTKDAMGVINNPRNRTVTCEELKTFWDILEKNKSLVTRTALQLLILLGSRTGELRLSTWNDLDTINKTLTIPPANQKLLPKQQAKAKPFVIPLDEFALQLFENLRGLDSIYIFSGTTPNKPFSDKALSKYTKRTLEKLEHELFTPHDLRRTFRTGLSKLGIQPHIAERCLNHSLGKILETYDQHDFLEERREALSDWSKYIQECIK